MKKTPLSYHTFHDIYALLFIVNFLGILFFGLYPGFQAFTKKRSFLGNMKDKNKEFSTLLTTAERKEALSQEIEPYLSSLDKAIPDAVYGDEVIKELLLMASKHGYNLSNISFKSSDDPFTLVSVSLTGDFNDLDAFLEKLENSEMGFSISSLAISFEDKKAKAEDSITLELKLFNLKEGKGKS